MIKKKKNKYLHVVLVMPEQCILFTSPFGHSLNGLPTLAIGFLALCSFFFTLVQYQKQFLATYTHHNIISHLNIFLFLRYQCCTNKAHIKFFYAENAPFFLLITTNQPLLTNSFTNITTSKVVLATLFTMRYLQYHIL